MHSRLVVVCVSVFVGVMLTTISVALVPQSSGQVSAAMDNALVMQRMATMPLAFTENRGQWDGRVLFRASAGGTTLWFCGDGITYQFSRRIPREKVGSTAPLATGTALHRPLERTQPDSIETLVIHAAFVGSNPKVELAGENLLEYRCNYFQGNNPAKWRLDVPNYAAVVYRNVYPGVDVRYEGEGGVLTCSFTAALESALAPVQFRYEGFDAAYPGGNAVVTETGLGQFRVATPWGAMLEPLSSGQAGGLAGNVDDPACGGAPVAVSTPEANGAVSVTLVYSTFLGGGVTMTRATPSRWTRPGALM